MALKASIDTVAPLHEGSVQRVPLLSCAQSVQLPLANLPPLLVSKSAFTSMVLPSTTAWATQKPVPFCEATTGAPWSRRKFHLTVTGSVRSARLTSLSVKTGVSVTSCPGTV